MDDRHIWDSAPDNDDLPGTIEHHTFEHPPRGLPDRTVEVFYHPPTATAARILENDDHRYSVQPTAGGCPALSDGAPEPGEAVVQPEDPHEAVSGSASVVGRSLAALTAARAVAYGWIRGWQSRNTLAPRREGGVRDVRRDDA